jgi:hypothetical protein
VTRLAVNALCLLDEEIQLIRQSRYVEEKVKLTKVKKALAACHERRRRIIQKYPLAPFYLVSDN